MHCDSYQLCPEHAQQATASYLRNVLWVEQLPLKCPGAWQPQLGGQAGGRRKGGQGHQGGGWEGRTRSASHAIDGQNMPERIQLSLECMVQLATHCMDRGAGDRAEGPLRVVRSHSRHVGCTLDR